MDYSNKALRPGTVLTGRKSYRIERVLGAGGFGITYLASTTFMVGSMRVKGLVAIKEHFMGDHHEREGDTGSVTCPGTEASRTLVSNSLKDFKAEARRLAGYGKDHPNIVKVNEIFEANGTAYYVMEYLDGHSLADYIAANGPIDEKHIRAFVVPVVDAVSFLHSHRLTHLDIKPGNIMLASNEDGTLRPVLIDFGLSKHYNADGSATSTVNTMACSDGFSPNEQYSGIRTFSPTADVYALGATMYSAAIGSIPTVSTEWPVGEPAATIATLPLSDRLRTVMTRAMAPYKYDRYADAGAMLSALGVSSARTEGIVTKPITEKKDGEKTRQPDNPKKPDSKKTELINPDRKPNRKGLINGAIDFAMQMFSGIMQRQKNIVESHGPDIVDAETVNGLTVNWGADVSAAQKEVLRRLINNMVYVDGGTFTMGASAGDSEASENEKPAHQVTLSSYRIGRYEVTQKEWKTVIDYYNPSRFRGDNLPVENVTWWDCQRFLEYLNEMTGLHFRLPTEAQWEYAARGGSRSNGYRYSGSDNINSVAWYAGHSGNSTHPVGLKPANELGLYDMSGNVLEWCSDWYGLYNNYSVTNPAGPSWGSDRVTRGGCWNFFGLFCRVSKRFSCTPNFSDNNLGLRLAL